ncbi:hypothetical protein A3H38_04680 [candidate division WOR-1 bacterium RIFCSPLOWO2_02_FULL_46_20]|uniref:Uncharacterized protein n=2 Tax=Saganbacteria TaxID=1703751 RepID=A0A1F4RB59_UNCSA|nr:MAG: hypothetical protein A3H38_04680 [candidate division WOR-1 bacterium RIFCSPLOWO2_02_FULL_46_20]OGC08980.1 MAG: hypothetical protein A3F86_06185 [candidate division WOR-1 bacterium RIFCSPLOWO2_12_FULL_45_9]
MENEKLYQAIENIRRDKNEPGRYIFFTFLNGIAQGLGMALGMTIIAAVLLFVVIKILARVVDLPVIGMYVAELVKFVSQYLDKGLPTR